MKKISALFAIAGLVATASAQAAEPAWMQPPTWIYGSVVPGAMAQKTVTITPDTHDLNVRSGQTIAFTDHGKSFAYEFDGPRADARVNLERVAPAGVINHPVYAYVGNFPVNK